MAVVKDFIPPITAGKAVLLKKVNAVIKPGITVVINVPKTINKGPTAATTAAITENCRIYLGKDESLLCFQPQPSPRLNPERWNVSWPAGQSLR